MLRQRLLALLPGLAHRLGLLLLALAVLLPPGLWLARELAPRAQLRWAITHAIRAPNDEELWNSGRFLDGGQIFLTNEGNFRTGEVRVRFALVPEHIDAYHYGPDDDVSPPEDTDELVLETLRPQDEVMINLYGFSPFGGVTVLEDGQPVSGEYLDPSEFDDPEVWFPDWAVYAGALVIAALVLEVLSLRGAARQGRRRPGSLSGDPLDIRHDRPAREG